MAELRPRESRELAGNVLRELDNVSTREIEQQFFAVYASTQGQLVQKHDGREPVGYGHFGGTGGNASNRSQSARTGEKVSTTTAPSAPVMTL